MPEEKNAECDVVVQNAMGLHARPAAMIVQCAGKFSSNITLQSGSELVSCSSILGLMVLSAGKGSKLHLSAVGPDADAALSALENLFEEKFGEE